MRYTLAIYENNKAWLYSFPPEKFRNEAVYVLQITATNDSQAIQKAKSMLSNPENLKCALDAVA